MSPQLTRKISGFTLVEMLVALIMSAMLLAVIVGVLKGVNLQLKIALQESKQSSYSSVAELLYSDMQNASAISMSGGWIWIEGVFPSFGRKESIAKRVGYRCVPWIKDGESALLRMADGQGELAAVGPRRFLIERLDSANMPQPLSTSPTAIPPRLRLWIWEENSEAATFIKDIVLR